MSHIRDGFGGQVSGLISFLHFCIALGSFCIAWGRGARGRPHLPSSKQQGSGSRRPNPLSCKACPSFSAHPKGFTFRQFLLIPLTLHFVSLKNSGKGPIFRSGHFCEMPILREPHTQKGLGLGPGCKKIISCTGAKLQQAESGPISAKSDKKCTSRFFSFKWHHCRT